MRNSRYVNEMFVSSVKAVSQREATSPLFVSNCLAEKLALQIRSWQLSFRPGASPKFGFCHYLCLCLTNDCMHIMNRQLFPIKIILSSIGLLSTNFELNTWRPRSEG